MHWIVAMVATGLPVAEAEDSVHTLSDTRLLRRTHLTLLGTEPTPEQYQQMIAAGSQGERDAIIEAVVHDALDSEAFYQQLLPWGHDYLAVGSYDYGYNEGVFVGNKAIDLEYCPSDSVHADAIGSFNTSYPQYGDDEGKCYDTNAEVTTVEPWWAPGSTVRVVGNAGLDIRESDGVDCGGYQSGLYDVWMAGEGCSCGPNLVYCQRWGRGGWYEELDGDDGDNFDADSQRRSAFEEPARLFAHIIAEDLPFSDLVLGDYTLVNQGLHHLYVRNARQNPAQAWLDDVEWWRGFADPGAWRVVYQDELHPNLLPDRDYAFDPRVDASMPDGIPSAGVLTQLAANVSFGRERVRGARWLEALACVDFVPPPSDIDFGEYVSDPGTEGVCQHCHQLLDPASIYFKRTFGAGGSYAGIGPWTWDELQNSDDGERWDLAFLPDSLMTPVSAAEMDWNGDARFLDFLPDGMTLFGTTGDGTIGPLGFGKVLVESGEFDQCAVRRIHEKFGGRALDEGTDQARIDELVTSFVASDRSVKELIREILLSEEFRQGW